MIVTRIEEVSRSRSRIYLDERFAFVLYKGELRLYGIREGQTLEEASYMQIMQEVLPKRAKLRCMNLLKSRAYTEKQLRDKLEQGQYPRSCIDTAIDYVKAFHYVDDEQFVRDYIENQQGKKSRRMIEMDLMRKGIDKGQIQAAFETLSQEGEDTGEEPLARRLLEKKRIRLPLTDYKERQKAAAFLYRKGIAQDVIHKVLGNMETE